jgi:hypothetical protein
VAFGIRREANLIYMSPSTHESNKEGS